jgi:hypothetical protein
VMVMLQAAQTYADLQKQIHNDLRSQHPEWIQPNGESPMCAFYEARLTELLKHVSPNESKRSSDGLATN